MDLERFAGVVAATPTLFTQEGAVDESAMGQLMSFYIDEGLNGAFLLSSTGEYFAMTKSQRRRVLAAAVTEAKGRLALYAMVSDACLETVLANIDEAAGTGVDALVLTAPYYYLYSQQELYRFFEKAADRSPLPLLLYNQPLRLPSALGEELVADLSRHPNIIGLKDTSPDAGRLTLMASRFGGRQDFLYYAGSERLAGLAALLGVHYVYALASVRPRLFLRMRQLGAEGRVKEVFELQKRVETLMGIFGLVGKGSSESFNHFTQGIKGALQQLGIGQAYSAQLCGLPTSEEVQKIARLLAEVDRGMEP